MPRLSPDRRKLLALLLEQRGVQAPARRQLAKRAARTRPPASRDQTRLWFLDQLDPGNSLYNDCVQVHLEGAEIDLERLQAALDEVVQRHSSLRTSFIGEGGLPVQAVEPSAEVELRFLDMSSDPEASKKVRAALLKDVRGPFSLDRGPLVRATLARTSDRTYELGLTMHHIISDGASFGIFLRELGVIYSQGKESLPALELQFDDYAAWEQESLDEERLRAGLAFWKSVFPEPVADLNLPRDFPRPEAPASRGHLLRVQVPDELTAKVRAFCMEQEVTGYQVELTAYLILLHGLGGQTDFVIGTPSSCRNRVELEGMIGFFVRTVLLRNDLQGDPDVNELIARSRARVLEAFEHDDVPFDRVIQAIGNQSASGAPLIQGWFAHMHGMITAPQLPDFQASYQLFDSDNSRFDLSLIVDESEQGIALYFEYDVDLFTPATVERIAQLYVHVLRRCVESPTASLSALREEIQTHETEKRGSKRAARFSGLKGVRRTRARSASQKGPS